MTNKARNQLDEDTLLFQQEKLLIDVAALINKAMKDAGLNRTQLANLLNVTKGRVTQYLCGERNLTLRTLADILTSLDSKLVVDVAPLAEPKEEWTFFEAVCPAKSLEKAWKAVGTLELDTVT